MNTYKLPPKPLMLGYPIPVSGMSTLWYVSCA